MASIFDNGPSGVNLPDLRQWQQQTWGAGPSSMRQTEPSDYPGYGRRNPTPARKPGLQDDIYQGVEESFNPIGADQAVDALQVRPTEFAKELLEYRAINGVTPEKDRDTIEAWNRYKKEQYQRRGQGGWEPTDTPNWYGSTSSSPLSSSAFLRQDPYPDKNIPISKWALESTELVNPRAIMAEARAMEDQGSAEGIEMTQQPDVGEASVVQPPKFRGNY